MSNNSSFTVNGDFVFGASLVSLVNMIPEHYLSDLGKGILFVVGAFLSGFCYKAGQTACEFINKKRKGR